MLRWTKWVTPMAALVLMAGFQAGQARAEDPATPTANGKATVTVTVVDADGKPVPDATVGISAAPQKKPKGDTTQPVTDQPRARPTPLVTGTTGADGTCALAKVPDGEYTVMARSKTAGVGRSKVTIADDKDEAVSLTLKPRKAK
jgi:hypothetical protein